MWTRLQHRRGSARGRGSLSSPAFSTSRARRRGCGSSPARRDRTRGRSCGSPTPTGLWVTAIAANSVDEQLSDLDCRRRARTEDRVRCAKDSGLRNLPLHALNQNHIWCAVVVLTAEFTA